jgi:hypothetical protein
MGKQGKLKGYITIGTTENQGYSLLTVGLVLKKGNSRMITHDRTRIGTAGERR